MNRLRTAPWVFRLLYRISGLLNFFARRFDRAANEKDRAAPLPEGPLCGQRLPPLAALPYGAYTVGYCGCEVIAVYNVLLTLGRPRPFAEVAAALEGRGLLCNGLGGTHLGAAVDYLRAAGCRVKALGARSAASYDAAFDGARSALLAFWTGRTLRRPDRQWNMLHTVALAHAPEGGVLVYNADTASSAPVRAPSVTAFLQRGDYLPVLLCCSEMQVDKPAATEYNAQRQRDDGQK